MPSRPQHIEPCAISLTTKSQTNTTGVRLHSTLEFTIMEMPSVRHLSLPAPGSLCIFISGLWPAVPLRPTGPAGPILHPGRCLLRREDSLNPNRVKKNLGVSRNCNFGHRMEHPGFLQRLHEALVPQPSQMQVLFLSPLPFVVSYRILCFELETDGSFRWSARPHSPCFCPISFIQSHLPFPCTIYT